MATYYLEYRIVNNRKGLLGDIASFLGLVKVNIETIASIDESYRGFLININSEIIKEIIIKTLSNLDDLELTALRKPRFWDLLALKHGKKIKQSGKNFFSFQRKDLELLIDFLSGYLSRQQDILVGFKGSPRIGKTETAIAAAIHANKRWQLLSTTLLRKIARTRIAAEALNPDSVFIIDAATTFYRANAEHIKLVREILQLPLPRIVEHPKVLVKELEYSWEDFDLIIELIEDENCTGKDNLHQYLHSYNSFDIS